MIEWHLSIYVKLQFYIQTKYFAKMKKKDISRQTKLRELKLAGLHNKWFFFLCVILILILFFSSRRTLFFKAFVKRSRTVLKIGGQGGMCWRGWFLFVISHPIRGPSYNSRALWNTENFHIISHLYHSGSLL